MRIKDGKKPKIVGSTGASKDLEAFIKSGDAAGRTMEGLLGVQVHFGPPMKVELRNSGTKKLTYEDLWNIHEEI